MSMDPEKYLAYLAKRDGEREMKAGDMLARLTERERNLVREAAVLGYVQGTMNPDPKPFPRDGAILTGVLIGATDFSNLYPTLAALAEEE